MIAIVVNPAAGNGRARKIANDVLHALRHRNDVFEFATTSRGDETHQVARALEGHARCIVVVGGDGSVHHVARALVSAPRRVPLAIVAAGTGNDFVKSLGTPAHDVRAMTQCIERAQVRSIDVGLIDGTPFVNAAGLGFDVAVLELMQRAPLPWLGGTASYVVTALRALLGYRGFDASLRTRIVSESAGSAPTADAAWQERIGHFTHLMTVFANGRHFGGAFRIAPNAQLDDGMLDVIDIGALAPWRRPAVFLRAVQGNHERSHAVRSHFGTEFTLHCETPPMYEADGELYRAQSNTITVTLRPSALDIIV